MAGYTLNWQDFMKEPENKALMESKGIHACKQKFIQEQNKMMWHDPVIIQENQSPGQSVNNAVGADGGNTPYITGKAAEVSTFTWAISPGGNDISGWTGSDGGNFSVTAYTIHPGVDYSSGHSTIRKKVGLFFLTSSTLASMVPSTAGYDVIVTASYTDVDKYGTSEGATGSMGQVMARHIVSQSAGAVVVGFTNTVAPSTLMTVVTASGGGATFTITNAVGGDVYPAATSVAATTGSIAQTTPGNAKYLYGGDGEALQSKELPWKNLPFASDTSYL